MYFSCIKCGHLKVIPDSVYGKSAKCPECGTVQTLSGAFDPKQYEFNYSCDCGFSRKVPIKYFGKNLKCPKCSTVNKVGYSYKKIIQNTATDNRLEETAAGQTKGHPDINKQPGVINDKLKDADQRDLFDILKQALQSFDAIGSNKNSSETPTSKKKQSTNELVDGFLAFSLVALAYIMTSPPSFIFFIKCILSVELLLFLLKAVALGFACTFVIFFIAACGRFNFSQKLNRNIFEATTFCIIALLLLFGYNFVNRSIERTSVQTISEKYKDGYEVSPGSIEKVKDGYYRGLAVISSSTNKYTIKYVAYINPSSKKDPETIYTKWYDPNLK
jgi:phage FluMu protein Com